MLCSASARGRCAVPPALGCSSCASVMRLPLGFQRSPNPKEFPSQSCSPRSVPALLGGPRPLRHLCAAFPLLARGHRQQLRDNGGNGARSPPPPGWLFLGWPP